MVADPLIESGSGFPSDAGSGAGDDLDGSPGHLTPSTVRNVDAAQVPWRARFDRTAERRHESRRNFRQPVVRHRCHSRTAPPHGPAAGRQIVVERSSQEKVVAEQCQRLSFAISSRIDLLTVMAARRRPAGDPSSPECQVGSIGHGPVLAPPVARATISSHPLRRARARSSLSSKSSSVRYRSGLRGLGIDA